MRRASAEISNAATACGETARPHLSNPCRQSIPISVQRFRHWDDEAWQTLRSHRSDVPHTNPELAHFLLVVFETAGTPEERKRRCDSVDHVESW